MSVPSRINREDIEQDICDLAVRRYYWVSRNHLSRLSSINDDIEDSLDMTDFYLALEVRYNIRFPDLHQVTDPTYQAIMTREPLRVADLAEAIYYLLAMRSPSNPG